VASNTRGAIAATNNLAASQTRAQRIAARASAMATPAGGAHGGGFFTNHLKLYGAYKGGQLVGQGTHTAFEQAFSVEQSKALMGAAGMAPHEIEAAHERAKQLAKEIPQLSVAEHFSSINELRSVLGDTQTTLEEAGTFAKAQAILNAAKAYNPHAGNIDLHGQARDFARALEIKGVSQDKEKRDSYMESMLKSIIAFGGQLDASDFHQAFKFGRSATRGWDHDFVQNYLPTIMNEIKAKGGSASGAGNALMSLKRTIVDGKMTKDAMAAWDNLGLLNEPSVIRNAKTGKPKALMEHAIKGWEVAMRNPYEFMQSVLIPALEKKNGGKMPEEEQLISSMGQLFGNRVAEAVAQILALQKTQLEKDRKLVETSLGFDALKKLELTSPTAAIQGFTAAFKDLAGAFSSPSTAGVLKGIRGLSDVMRGWTDWAEKSETLKRFGGNFEKFVDGLFSKDRFKKPEEEHDDFGRTWKKDNPDDNQWHFLGDVIGNALEKHFGVVVKIWTTYFQTVGEALSAFTSGLRHAADGLNWIANKLGFGPKEEKPISPYAYTKPEGFRVTATPNLPGMFDPSTVVKNPAKKAFYQRKTTPDFTLGSSGFSFGSTDTYGGVKPGASEPSAFEKGRIFNLPSAGAGAVEELNRQLESIIPQMTGKGKLIMDGIASGMQQGAANVTTQVQGLMSSLQSIAAAGVTIPIKADTSGVAAQVRAAVTAGAAARGAEARNGGRGGVQQHVAVGGIHIHGSHDPKATAKQVKQAFNESVERHLSDIG